MNCLDRQDWEKNLSISEISRVTRISKSMIQSLENGEVENLPGRTYEIGYIKLICQVTNTNPDPIVKNGLKNTILTKIQTHIIFLNHRLFKRDQ